METVFIPQGQIDNIIKNASRINIQYLFSFITRKPKEDKTSNRYDFWEVQRYSEYRHTSSSVQYEYTYSLGIYISNDVGKHYEYSMLDFKTDVSAKPESIIDSSKNPPSSQWSRISIDTTKNAVSNLITSLYNNCFYPVYSCQVEQFLERNIRGITFVLDKEKYEIRKKEECKKEIQENYIDFISKYSLTNNEAELLSGIQNAGSITIKLKSEALLSDDTVILSFIEIKNTDCTLYLKLAYDAVKYGSSFSVLKNAEKALSLLKNYILPDFILTDSQIKSLVSRNAGAINLFRASSQQATNNEANRINTLQRSAILSADLKRLEIPEEITNLIIKFEGKHCYMLLSNGELYTEDNIKNKKNFIDSLYTRLEKKGFKLPYKVIEKYIGKGDYSAPIYFKR